MRTIALFTLAAFTKAIEITVRNKDGDKLYSMDLETFNHKGLDVFHDEQGNLQIQEKNDESDDGSSPDEDNMQEETDVELFNDDEMDENDDEMEDKDFSEDDYYEQVPLI